MSAPGKLPNCDTRSIGFGEELQFQWGGTHSGRTVRHHFGNGVYSIDEYPSDLISPATQRVCTSDICNAVALFFHSFSDNRRTNICPFREGFCKMFLRRMGAAGDLLIQKMQRYGFQIESGFLDRYDPRKQYNHFRAWQDRFQTEDREKPTGKVWNPPINLTTAGGRVIFQRRTHPVLIELGYTFPRSFHMIKTRISLFPRIAWDEPSIRNGFRRFSF